MEYVRNFLKDNLMLLLFGVVLLCIASLGSLANPKMDYHSVSEGDWGYYSTVTPLY